MSNFILIAFCILAGVLFRKRKLVPADAHKTVNAWIINIALPAVSFKYLPFIHWTAEMLIPALTPIILFAGAYLFIRLLADRLKLNKATRAGLQLAAGLSNTSFVGFPLIMAYYGEEALSIAIICDQVTFMLFSVFGMMIAIRATSHTKTPVGYILKKVGTFPPFIGCIAALLIPKSIDLNPYVPFFHMLAATVAPMALFSIGLQLSFRGWRNELKPVIAVLSYKLFIAPAIVLGFVLLTGARGMIPKISVFEAAMPILLSMSVMADTYQLNSRLVNLIIGLSILASFLTTGLWYLVLQNF